LPAAGAHNSNSSLGLHQADNTAKSTGDDVNSDTSTDLVSVKMEPEEGVPFDDDDVGDINEDVDLNEDYAANTTAGSGGGGAHSKDVSIFMETSYKARRRQKKMNFCAYCKLEFEKFIAYSNHMKDNHPEFYLVLDDDRYQCKSCSSVLKSFQNFSEHVKLFAGETECPVCKEAVVAGCELSRHRKLHLKEEERFCRFCNKTFASLSKSKFDKHLLKEHGVVTRKRKRSKKTQAENVGGGSETEDSNFGGDVNGEGNVDSNDGGVKTYYCPYCKLELEGAKAYSAHMQTTHSDQFMTKLDNSRYQCKYCDSILGKAGRLYEHMRMEVSEKVCDSCGEEMRSKCELSQHRRKHRLEKARWCAWCEKSFTKMRVGEFTRHAREHRKNGDEIKNGVDPGIGMDQVCSVCGKMYPSK
jgi:hypothetical protein